MSNLKTRKTVKNRHTNSISVTSRKFFNSTNNRYRTTTTNQSRIFEPTKSQRQSQILDFRPKKTLDNFNMDNYPLEIISRRDRHKAIIEQLEA